MYIKYKKGEGIRICALHLQEGLASNSQKQHKYDMHSQRETTCWYIVPGEETALRMMQKEENING